MTPLRAARRMSSLHTDSAVVIKESMGHGAVLVGPRSLCLEAIARTYFDEGKVPEGEVTCEAACGPWDDKDRSVCVFEAETEDIAKEFQKRKKFPLGI